MKEKTSYISEIFKDEISIKTKIYLKDRVKVYFTSQVYPYTPGNRREEKKIFQ